MIRKGLAACLLAVATPLVLAVCTRAAPNRAARTRDVGTATGAAALSNLETKAPAIDKDSTAGEITAYVDYYKAHGYTVTTDRRVFTPGGTVASFHFVARLHNGSGHAGINVGIDAASDTDDVAWSSETTIPGRKRRRSLKHGRATTESQHWSKSSSHPI